MLNIIENIPDDLVGKHVFGFLEYEDLVQLENASLSQKSRKIFLDIIPHCPPVKIDVFCDIPNDCLLWFANRNCRLLSLNINLPSKTQLVPDVVKNLQVEHCNLTINASITVTDCQILSTGNFGQKVKTLHISCAKEIKGMEFLSTLIPNITELTVNSANICLNWLSNEVISKWKLKKVKLLNYSTKLILRIVENCHELTDIEIQEAQNTIIDDAAITAIANNCPKLELLHLVSGKCTHQSLQALSEKKLPLVELDIENLPVFPNADAAARCAHALARLRHINTLQLVPNLPIYHTLLPLLTGPSFVTLESAHDMKFAPLLITHCHTAKIITVTKTSNINKDDLLALLCGNPLLWRICNFHLPIFTDDAKFVQLLDACPLLKDLHLSSETLLTDTSLLALSKHYPKLDSLDLRHCASITNTGVMTLAQHCSVLRHINISECIKVTKAAVAALLQHCPKLFMLGIPKRSYSCYMFDEYEELQVIVGRNRGDAEEEGGDSSEEGEEDYDIDLQGEGAYDGLMGESVGFYSDEEEEEEEGEYYSDSSTEGEED